MKHYIYGGSTAARTTACPAWHSLSAALPKPPSSGAAQLGTALHKIIEETVLDVDLDPFDYAGTTVEGVKITDSHIAEKVYPALDAFEELMDTYQIETYLCETTNAYNEKIGSTADFFGLSADGKTAVFADYKSGDGIMVYAEACKQLLHNAMCGRADKLKAFFADVDRLVLAIIQPSERREATLDVWETDLVTLDRFHDEYLAAVALAEAGDTDPVMGSHCAFCPAEVTCPAKTGLVAESERLPADSLIIEQVNEALHIADGLESWIAAVRKFAHEQLERGVELPDWKLVAKRATRRWKDEAEVEELVRRSKKLKGDEAHTQKLLSPTQLQKLCDSKGIPFDKFEECVHAVSSGTTLAAQSDPRPNAIPTEAARLVAQRFQ